MKAGEVLAGQRGKVMGYAALMVIIYHCFFEVPSGIGNFLFGTNNKMGVDLFVFLSGFGLALSLSKKPGWGSYCKRRLRRLLPSYYVVLMCMLPVMGMTLKSIVISVIPVNVWFGNEDLWYVSASIGYYLLVPFIYMLLERIRFHRIAACLLVAVFALAVPWALSFMNAEIALMRIPALVMGVHFGVCSLRSETRGDRIKNLALPVFFACCGIAIYITKCKFGMLGSREVSFLWKNLCAPLFALTLAQVFNWIDRSPIRKVGVVFEELGKYSLEIYFAHLCIKVVVQKLVSLPPVVLMVVLLAGSYPAARIIYWIGRQLLRLVDRIFEKKRAR